MQKRILVVDDDDMNLARTKMILAKEYDVLLADSGVRALHTSEKSKGGPGPSGYRHAPDERHRDL